MIGALVLWSYALAALLFAAAAVAELRRPRAGRTGRAFAGALTVSALWALAVAGIGMRDLSTLFAEGARDLAWLGFGFALVRRGRAGWALLAVYVVVAGVVSVGAGLGLLEEMTRPGSVHDQLGAARLVFRMMAAAGALVLARHVYAVSAERGPVRTVAVTLALLWGADLLRFAAAYAKPGWTDALAAASGIVASAVALLLGAAAQRREDWTLALSRPAATRALIAVALVTYVGLVACAAAGAAVWGGAHGRALQAAVVIGAATVLLCLASTSWLGAWAKVKLAKHLFRHRYDYRVEWQRFTDTLSAGDEPLEARVAAAIARLLDAPGGLLLEGSALAGAGGWRWQADGEGGAALARHLASGRIVELDAVRAGLAEEDRAAVPHWMVRREDAWALVPLMGAEALAGAVLLARPPVARALDWEDFDLLRVAGRQAASYLAEDRAGRALADARRFDEFNRRFAFILHDLKNLVSQQQLVARNAERHADNPDFRADMVATLKESADRMTGLLAKLAHREHGGAEPLGVVDAKALVERVARGRRAQHPVRCTADPLFVLAQAGRMEQVLAHLVQNAIEAGGDRPVELSVGRAGDRVAIEVADGGRGMSAAFVRDELFRPFASTKADGFGLGAFEARQLVTAMGGDLTVESREGEGTRFCILLPAAERLEEAA